MDWMKMNAGSAMVGGGTALSAISNLQAANATRMSAVRKKQAAEFAATQLEQNAGQQLAAGQAGAAEQRRQGKIIQSNILANAAASGGGASDPSIVNLMARTAGETAYRAALSEYEGQDAARSMNLKASTARYGAEITSADAEDAASAYQTKAIATTLTGMSPMFSKYWAMPGAKDLTGG